MTRYEELRAGALGDTTRAKGMLLFLRQGMARWIRCLNDENLFEHKASSLCIKETHGSSDVASILADAVLGIP